MITFNNTDGMSSVATGGTGATGKQGGVPFLDNSSDDDTGKPHAKKFNRNARNSFSTPIQIQSAIAD
jgi:hypothetical protein